MIGNPLELRKLTQSLAASTWTLAALGALFESGLADRLREPQTLDDLAPLRPGLPRGRLERTLAILADAGVVVAEGGRYRLAPGALPLLAQPMRAALEGDIRSQLMQSLAYLESSSSAEVSPGWAHTDPALLQAQGDASAVFAVMCKSMLAPALGDLAQRLEQPGARFLDVGTGVGGIAIAMSRAFPQLHTVGLDPFDVPLGIARRNVARADLAARIELRQLAVQHLRDEACFDLAWMPTFFVAGPVQAAALARVRAALRVGGWVVIPSGSGDAVIALLIELWGGEVLPAPDCEALLEKAGLAEIRSVSGPVPGSALVVGRRAD